MRHISIAILLCSMSATGCSGTNKSASSSGEGSTSTGSKDQSSSSESGGSDKGSSSKVSRDPLVYDGMHLNEWLKLATSNVDGDRRGAAQALGVIGANAPDAVPTVVPVLGKLLGDNKMPVRRNAAESLAGLGPNVKEAVPALADALKDGEKDVRMPAMKALLNAGADAGPALPRLIEVLENGDRTMRSDALRVVGQLKAEPKDVLPALKIAMGDKTNADYAIKLTVALGEPALPELIEWLKNKNEILNNSAAIALARFGPKAKAAIPQLLAALNDPDRQFRKRAADALAAIGPEGEDANTVTLALIEKLKDEDTCTSAANAIIKIGPKPELVPTLIRIVKDGKSGSKQAAANVLIAIGKPAVAPLVDLMIINNTDTLETVAYALGKIGSDAREVLPRLFLLLQDNDDAVSLGAKKAIERIGPEDDMVPRLVDIVTGEKSYGRYYACQLLVHPKLRKNGIPKLVELLSAKGSDALVPEAIRDVLSALKEVQPQADAKPAVDAIVALLKHEDEDVRAAAAKALKKIDPVTAAKNGVK